MTSVYARFHEGQIQWRGSNASWTFKAFDDAERLAEQFERCPDEDWFYNHAMERARQLRHAMAELVHYEESLCSTS